MTSNGLAAAWRVRLPSSETNRTPGRGRRGRLDDHGRQRAAMADADQRDAPGLQHPVQPVAAGAGQRRQRQRRIRRPLGATVQNSRPQRLAIALLERDALGSRALDEDVHQPGADRLADQPVDLDPRHAEPAGDLLLGLVAHIGEPCRTRREAELVCLQPRPP